MLDFQQKRKIRSVAYNRITLFILFILILIIGRSTWMVYRKERTSQDMKNVSLQNVEELRLRNDELTAKIARLETTPGVEEEIRSKFNVVKSEENMVVIVENEKDKVSTTSPEI
ncbi:MAG: septum formation initiator family protein, partial [Candidatus Zambryskibacteria bacterium]|nr:septum formation initiator family protein [Candidatus Zambryskibacteria bacterium]